MFSPRHTAGSAFVWPDNTEELWGLDSLEHSYKCYTKNRLEYTWSCGFEAKAKFKHPPSEEEVHKVHRNKDQVETDGSFPTASKASVLPPRKIY
jgi:hypothetical protein